MFSKLRNPVALVVQGFFAGALLFAVATPGFVQHRSAAADAQASALVQELTR
jgi:hypothetical protein